MKPVKIDHEDIKKVIQSDFPYIQVGEKKYLLMEVEEVKQLDSYIVTDPEEEKQLLDALNKDNRILSDDEITKMLGH